MARPLPPFRALVFIFFALFLTGSTLSAQSFTTINSIPAVPTSASAATGEKPQSKVWTYDGKWFAVFPSGGNTLLWRLHNGSWTNDLVLSSGNAYADCKAIGDAAHILLYKGTASELVSLQYNTNSGTYQLWSERPATVPVSLDPSVETATIDIDDNGRMWLASEGSTTVNVRWSDPPYTTWNGPVTIASGINSDDICAVISMPGRTGVLWSNQTTKRYGFRSIANGLNPADIANWSSDEIPASQSALNVGGGMADDHLNIKVASDGTLYCAVKTSYDGSGYPRIALLVRRPSGTWDNLYDVGSSGGTRPIVILNEDKQTLKVLYTSSESGGNILYKESALAAINFGSQQTLISGNYNNVTSSKSNYDSTIVVLASSGTQIVGVVASDGNTPPPAPESLVLHLNMQEESGSTLIDASSYENNGTLFGNATRVPGLIGQALALDGTNDYAIVPDHSSLDISSNITLAAWIRPEIQGTQRIIYKLSGSAGYELFLASPSPQQFSVRFNNNASLRVNSTSSYMNFLNTWVHVAATYDGSTIKLYINGQLESSANANFSIGVNAENVAIGATNAAADDFRGGIDEVRIYNAALSAADILELAALAPLAPVLTTPANAATNVSIEPTLSWNSVPGAESYRLQVASDTDFSSVVFEQAAISGTSAIVTGLMTNSQYFWRVLATSNASDGEWSAPWSFTTTEVELDDALVGYWKFEESVLSALIDSSAYGNNGTAIGNPARTTGLVGNALELNGSSQYATVPDNASLDITGQITLAAWIRPGALKTQYIIRKGNQSSSSGNGYELSLSSAGKVFFRINQNASGNTYRVDSDIDYPVSGADWMHVAGTYDGTSLKIYINGILDNTVSPPPTTILTNNQVLAIGAQSDGAAASRFNGTIDEARVYSIALSESQIAALLLIPPVAPELISPVNGQTDIALTPTLSWHAVTGAESYRLQVSLTEDFAETISDQSVETNSAIVSNLAINTLYYWRVSMTNTAGTSPWSDIWQFTTTTNEPASPLIGHWRFDEVDGTIVNDASSYSNNGITVGGPVRTAGVSGQALRLNGTTQYVSVPDNPSLDITEAITLAAWIKPNRIGTQYILRKGIQSSGDAGGVNGYELSLSNPGNVFFRFNQASHGDTYRVNSTTIHPADGNTWVHIAGTYDGVTLKVYINGILSDSLTPSNPINIATNNQPLNIGAQSSGSVNFDGDIDDARVYNTALSEIEIQGLIAAALPVKLHTFTARNVGSGVLLNWQTASETNNSGFHVERSADGLNFSSLGFVAGKSINGNSTVNIGYSFTDAQPLNGTMYYRLKQEDLDGRFHYSKVVAVRTEQRSIQLLNLYPNPVLKDVNIMLNAELNTSLDISILDLSGSVITNQKRNAVKGNNTYSIDVSMLKAGAYFLRIVMPGKNEIGLYRFIKQ